VVRIETSSDAQLVDWADEEGARFGRSLFGSSAAAGTLAPGDVRGLRDAEGIALPDALARYGIELDSVGTPGEASRGSGPTSSSTSSRGRCWRISAPRRAR
jgi:hypothetical protein